MRQNVVQKQSTTRFLAQLRRSLHHAVYFNIFPPLSPFSSNSLSSLSSCEALQKAIEEEKQKSEILPSRLQASDLPRKQSSFDVGQGGN
ncbi:hypothetical protein NC652_004320 [Populus alba x Populus x berolinensis]|nr:hypothetical protein NC652_004320 [Populus alba x Populus x berolinensis]